jgi:RimJ/RimL family protein N-acetyltransferase
MAARQADAVPVLTTSRLTLRAPRATDFATYAEIAATAHGHDPEDRATRNNLWLDFAQMVAGWLLHGAGLWSIERQTDRALLGFLPLNHEHGDPELEIGWFLRAAHRGQGYATEVASAARAFAFTTLGLPTLVSYIDPANAASIAVAERLGALREPDLFTGCLVYRHDPQGAA